jgi:hypothetical protein
MTINKLIGDQCCAEVEHRDTYRVSRGRGFRLHYNVERCKRKAVDGKLCRQHAKVDAYRYLKKVRYE